MNNNCCLNSNESVNSAEDLAKIEKISDAMAEKAGAVASFNGETQKKAVIKVTAEATIRIQELLAQENQKNSEDRLEAVQKALRIEVKMGGCAGIAYNFSLASEPQEGDEVVLCRENIYVYIAKKAVFFILNSELDYIDLGNFSKKFIFRNPNAKGSCGCGESFAV